MSRIGDFMRAVRDHMNAPTEHSITRFAWGMVAVISVALVALNWYTISTLSARDWCAQIMTTEKYLGDEGRLADPENIRLIIEWCARTGQTQLEAIGWVAKVLAVALGLVPAAVFVVKFSGANVSGSVAGNSFRMGRNEAADRVADAAEEEADRIAGDDR